MEVFVLLGVIDYEGDMLIGTYASFEEAVDAQGVYTRDHDVFDRYVVIRSVLGAAACYTHDDRVYI